MQSIFCCPFDQAYGRCDCRRRSSSSSQEMFCRYEERLGRCTLIYCNAKHKSSAEKETLPILCKSWQEGKCVSWRCKDRHYYIDDDDALPQSKRFVDEDSGSSRQTSFSSPYCVKIQKEIIKKRKVEVDLETGKVDHDWNWKVNPINPLT